MQNYRYDEFLGVAEPVLKSETVKVPSASKFYVRLEEQPLETIPSTVLVRDAASTVTANPDRDCSVLQQTNTNNDDPNVYVGRSTASSGGWLYRAFLHFDVSALASSPSKVLLRLYLTFINGDSPTQNISVHRVTSTWTETGPTWTTQPTYDPDPLGAFAIAPRGEGKDQTYSGWYETDVTALYALWKSGTNYGLMLKADETVYSYCAFQSRTGGAPIIPQLMVIAGGALYTQVGQTVAPTGKEFACSYETGRLRFPATAAGLSLVVDYLGMGSAVDAQDVGLRFTTAGTSTAYTVTSIVDRITLVSFLVIFIKMHTSCGNNATLNPDGLGAKNLQIKGGNVTTGQLAIGNTYMAIYDGTNFQVIGA